MVAKPGKLILLIGESGSGKSALMYEFMVGKRREGKLFLHLFPEVVRDTQSITAAVIAQLKIEAPQLYTTDEHLQNLIHEEIILIIDDVNQAEYPAKLLAKLQTWIAMPANIPAKIVCPVWPKNLAIEMNSRGVEHGGQLWLPPLTEKDALSILDANIRNKQLSLSFQQKKALITDLGKDPLLINLYVEEIGSGGQYNAHDTLEILSRYLASKTGTIADHWGVPAIQLRDALVDLGAKMLAGRVLSPSYQRTKEWLGSQSHTFTAINLIAGDRQILQFTDGGEIIFRHDRVRDAILIESIMSMFQQVGNNGDVLADPFFAELIGAALAKATITPELVQQIIELNPLAVFCALKFLQDEKHTKTFTIVETCITQWNVRKEASPLPKEVIQQIGAALIRTDTRHVDKILSNLPNTYEITLAKLHNGDTSGAIMYFMFGDATSPFSRNYWRDMVIDHARQHHMATFLKGIQHILPSAYNERGRQGIYRLAGFLQAPTLVPYLQQVWLPNQNNDQYPDYLWAIVQCATADERASVEEALSYWTIISDKKEPGQGPISPADHVNQLVRLFNWSFSLPKIEMLVDIARKNKLVEWQVTLILQFIDNPTALQFIAEYLGKGLMTSPQQSHARIFMDFDRWDYKKNNRRLSRESVAFLAQLWKDRKNNPGIREVAFRFWHGSCDPGAALLECKGIKSNDKDLYDLACLYRTKLGDQTVTAAMIKKIRKDKYFWAIDHIWNNKLGDFLCSALQDSQFSKHRRFMEDFWKLMVHIPTQDAEKIISAHWTSLKKWRRAIGTALYIATPTLRSLAAAEITRMGFNNWPKYEEHYRLIQHGTVAYSPQDDPFTPEEHTNVDFLMHSFQHIDQIFGVNYTYGKDQLTEEKLTTLIPYLSLLDETCLNYFAKACVENAWLDLLNHHFLPLLVPAERKKVYPNDIDLLEELIKMGSKYQPADVYDLITHGKKRGVTNERIIAALRQFSGNAHSISELQLICSFLIEIGTRQDLDMLDFFLPDDDVDSSTVSELQEGARYLVRRKSLV
jgi:hypothetical protein